MDLPSADHIPYQHLAPPSFLPAPVSREAHAYQSTSLSGNEEIVLSPTSECTATTCWCEDCDISIGVFAWSSGGVAFSIVAASSLGTTRLQSGVPVQATVGKEEFIYYEFNVPADMESPLLQLTLTRLSGDPDVFMSSTVHHPNATNAEWYVQ